MGMNIRGQTFRSHRRRSHHHRDLLQDRVRSVEFHRTVVPTEDLDQTVKFLRVLPRDQRLQDLVRLEESLRSVVLTEVLDQTVPSRLPRRDVPTEEFRRTAAPTADRDQTV